MSEKVSPGWRCRLAQHSFWFGVLFFPGNSNWNGNGKTTYGDTRWWDTAVGLQQERCIMTELIRELPWSKPVHTILTISFVEGSGINMFWRALAKKTWTIRCWLAPGVNFGPGPGRLRFIEKQQTGLARSTTLDKQNCLDPVYLSFLRITGIQRVSGEVENLLK